MTTEYVQPEILPCPHCTSTNTVMDTEGFHDIVRCRGCGLRGPSATTGTDAACLWNRFARLAKDGPEQDDRIFCPTCKGSGFVLEPDEEDAPPAVATTKDAASDLMEALEEIAEDIDYEQGLVIERAADEIRRLRARVAELETENKRVGGLLQDAEDLLDSIDYERDDL